jgi:hypothetical protein
MQYPWLENANRRYTSLIQEDLDAEVMELEIGIAPETIPSGNDTAFSFRGIDVVRRC